jgi:P4 family phage/plasmid primase-like protien
MSDSQTVLPDSRLPSSEEPANRDNNSAPTSLPSELNGCPSRVSRFHRTDAGNAELFAKLFGENLRYDHASGRWLLWQEHWWVEDPTAAVLLLAKRSARWRARQYSKINDPEERDRQYEWAMGSETRSRLEATLKLAQSEPPIADSGRNWDSDPMLLGAANGVVDLRTGKLRPGKRSDLITMHIDLAFDAKASAPMWNKFLDEIFGGDKQLIEFVQRAVGYCLTGDTSEQVLFMCYGTGANGKSTFLDVLRFVFGPYAYNLPFSAFELKARSSIPNEIAALNGKRFVTAIETNESVELNEGRIKALTGSDPITARFLYREFFTFEPTGKFWLAFNHKPRVSDDSPGFWRRIRLIPFMQQFGDSKRDPELLGKLKAEAQGILNWAIQGALKWQAKGLGAPEVVIKASNQYRCDSDPVGEFLDDRCTAVPMEEVMGSFAGSVQRSLEVQSRENNCAMLTQLPRPPACEAYRFDCFEVSLKQGTLLQRGKRVRVQDLPFKMLVILLEKPGELVTKEELAERLWGQEIFTEIDQSLYVIAGKLRRVLGDDASQPRFIRTVSGKGYRFVESVTPVFAAATDRPVLLSLPTQPTVPIVPTDHIQPLHAERTSRRPILRVITVAIVAVLGMGFAIHKYNHRALMGDLDRVVVGAFTNSTGDRDLDGTLSAAIQSELQESPYLSLISDQKFHALVKNPAAASLQDELGACKTLDGQLLLKGIEADLGTAEGARKLIEQVPETDILVNNLGIYESKNFSDISDEDWLRYFEINLLGGIRLARHYFPAMLKQNQGRVIFVSSEAGAETHPDMIHYGVTKTGQVVVARGLAEMTKGTKVTVNSILPGPTRSEANDEFIRSMASSPNATF